jgi:hypothetical protein
MRRDLDNANDRRVRPATSRAIPPIESKKRKGTGKQLPVQTCLLAVTQPQVHRRLEPGPWPSPCPSHTQAAAWGFRTGRSSCGPRRPVRCWPSGVLARQRAGLQDRESLARVEPAPGPARATRGCCGAYRALLRCRPSPCTGCSSALGRARRTTEDPPWPSR